MIPRHSSVPSQSLPSQGAAPPPAKAREYFAVSFGKDGFTETEAWLSGLAPSVARRHLAFETHDDGGALATLEARLATAVVGIRVVLAGPETDVYAARATALRLGALDEELVLLVTPGDSRKVHCPHCQSTTLTHQHVGAVVGCSGCQRNLVIYHHFSRHTGTYLGYMVDAEEPAAREDNTEEDAA